MTMRARLAVLLIAGLVAAPAAAQTAGGVGGSSAGGVGGARSAGGVGGSSGTGIPAPTTGGVGATGTGSSPSPSAGSGLGSGATSSGGGIDLGSSGSSLSTSGVGASGIGGAGAATTEERASEGSTTINPLNVDSIARGGDQGATTSFSSGTQTGATVGTSGLPPSVSGAGPEALYEIPQPRVAVDLGAIRGALAAGPSATPKSDGR